MATGGAEVKRSKAVLIAFVAALCLLVVSGVVWWAMEESRKARQLSLPTQLKEGMTRQQVEAILSARITDERKEGSTGDVVVAYVVEYRGFLSYAGMIVDVRYDGETGKVKRVAWVDPRE